MGKEDNPTEKLLNEVEVVKQEVKEPKKQAISISYTLKSFKENIRKFANEGLLTAEEANKLSEIQDSLIKKWMEKQFK